jgi:hypothetical protein
MCGTSLTSTYVQIELPELDKTLVSHRPKHVYLCRQCPIACDSRNTTGDRQNIWACGFSKHANTPSNPTLEKKSPSKEGQLI